MKRKSIAFVFNGYLPNDDGTTRPVVTTLYREQEDGSAPSWLLDVYTGKTAPGITEHTERYSVKKDAVRALNGYHHTLCASA